MSLFRDIYFLLLSGKEEGKMLGTPKEERIKDAWISLRKAWFPTAPAGSRASAKHIITIGSREMGPLRWFFRRSGDVFQKAMEELINCQNARHLEKVQRRSRQRRFGDSGSQNRKAFPDRWKQSLYFPTGDSYDLAGSGLPGSAGAFGKFRGSWRITSRTL